MKKVLLAAILVSLIALAGCSTVYTPGARDLYTGNVAKLTASSVVAGNGNAVTSIKIDGVSYPLNERATTFVLTVGRHEVDFSHLKLPRWRPGTYYFEALPGGRYELVSFIFNSGVNYKIQTPEHKNVLKPLPADTP